MAVETHTGTKRLLALFVDGGEELRPARIRRQLLPLFQHQAAKFIDAQMRDQELDARPGAVALFAQPGEYTRDRLHRRQQLFFRQKLIEELRLVRHRAQTAADVERKAALHFAVDDSCLSDGAHVVHGHQAARILLAAGKRDLHFASEVLSIGVAHQEFRASLRVRRRVERFFMADSRQRAGRNIAHHIAAGFARRNPDGGEPAHERRRIVDVHVVKLNVLARGDMR